MSKRFWNAGFRPYPPPAFSSALQGPVRQRHVIYLQGFFPKGPGYYHGLLEREMQIYAKLHDIRVSCSRLKQIMPGIALRCELQVQDAQNSGDGVHVTYDFLKWDDLILKTYGAGFLKILGKAVWSFSKHVRDGAAWRFALAHWKYLIVWLYPYAMAAVLAVLAVAALFQVIVLGRAGSLESLAILIAEIIAIVWLYRLTAKNMGWLMLQNYISATQYACGKARWLDERLDKFARHVADVMQTSKADEILLVGHSFGSPLAVMVMDRALKLVPEPPGNERVKLLTLGDICCHIGFLRGETAQAFRQSVFRIASQQAVPWVLMWNGKDILNFDSTHPPMAMSAVCETPPRPASAFRWPVLYNANFRSAIPADTYNRFRWRFFRIHSQFIFASRLKSAHFDYMHIVSGAEPLPFNIQAD